MNKIAAIEMCYTHVLKENMAIVSDMLQEAAKNSVKLVILPEMFAFMGLKPQDKLTIKETFQNGEIQSFLSQQAKKFGIWIVGGTIPISSNNPNKIRAASLVLDEKGDIVARYDKINLFDAKISPDESYNESNTTESGNELVVIDTPVGKLGLTVCYDIRFPNLFRQLAMLGAEIIAVPSAFTIKTGEAHWELLTRSKAVENFCYIIGACQGGVHTSGRKTHGHSLIVDPWGTIIAKCDNDKSGVIYADINLEYLHGIRNSWRVP